MFPTLWRHHSKTIKSLAPANVHSIIVIEKTENFRYYTKTFLSLQRLLKT
jgi:hypothetical protein